MASVTALTAEKTLELMDEQVVGGYLSGNNLILVLRDESEINVGNVKGPAGNPTDAATIREALRGNTLNIGNLSGAVNLSTLGSGSLNNNTLTNATLLGTLTGNTTFNAATMPAVSAGTQFMMRLSQDGTGSRTLTLTGIRKPGGVLALSTAANAMDLVVFFYDGTNWFASLSGKGYAV